MGTDKHPLDWANGGSLVISAGTVSVIFLGEIMVESEWKESKEANEHILYLQ